MQLFLITHLTAVRVLFIIGIVLVVLPIIFFILRKKLKIRSKKISAAAGGSIAAGFVCLIMPAYWLYLDIRYDIGDYTQSDILFIASDCMNSHQVERMLRKGADPSKITRFGKSSFYNSVDKQDIESAKLMLKNGADPNGSGTKYFTPLNAACRNADLDMVRLLLTSGADPDYRPDKYVSALSCAAAYDEGYNYDLINLLCAAGANRQAVSIDSSGKVMLPFKYYFHKTVGQELTPEERGAYDDIAALLEEPYREWVMKNASFLN